MSPYPLAHAKYQGYVLHKSRTMYAWAPKIYERYMRFTKRKRS